jgi:cell division protein FtsL
MRDLSLTLAQPFLGRKKAKNPAAVMQFNFLLIAFIVVLGFVYLFQINSLGTRGYEIRQLEQKIKIMQTENKALQIQSSSLSSITYIQKKAESFNMIPATNATYMKDTDFALK